MADARERKYFDRTNGMIPVGRHESFNITYVPTGSLANWDGFPYYSPPVASIQFFDVNVRFAVERGDEIYFSLWEAIGIGDERDRLHLQFETRDTGPRVELVTKGVRSIFMNDKVLYDRYLYWRKLRETDDNVLIASSRVINAFNVLDDNYADKRGFQSPLSLTMLVDKRGAVKKLIPDYTNPTETFFQPPPLPSIT